MFKNVCEVLADTFKCEIETQAFEGSQLFRLEWQEAESRIVLERGNTSAIAAPGAAPSVQVPSQAAIQVPDANVHVMKAPLVGIHYSAPSPEHPLYVQMGQRVKKGDALCIIEAMKMMNELTASLDGVVTRILVQNKQMVEFDQPLFEVKAC